MRFIAEWLADEDGTTTLEYALLLALVSVSSILAWSQLGKTVASTPAAHDSEYVLAGQRASAN